MITSSTNIPARGVKRCQEAVQLVRAIDDAYEKPGRCRRRTEGKLTSDSSIDLALIGPSKLRGYEWKTARPTEAGPPRCIASSERCEHRDNNHMHELSSVCLGYENNAEMSKLDKPTHARSPRSRITSDMRLGCRVSRHLPLRASPATLNIQFTKEV